MITSPENKVIIQVKSPFTKALSNVMKMSAIQNGASVDPTDCVTIRGVVVSVPKRVSDNREYKGFSTKDLQPGDNIIFSYRVIYDFAMLAPDVPPVFRNNLVFNGKSYWLADIKEIFGVIKEDKVLMINGYTMATEYVEDKIVLDSRAKRKKGTKTSTLMHIGNPKEHLKKVDAAQGEIIYFNPLVAQHYELNEKKFIILNQHQILGKEVGVL